MRWAACRTSTGRMRRGAIFPTYTLGALAAAQLFTAARKANTGLMEQIAKGDFSMLLGWLRANVHTKGSIADTDTILTQATCAPLGTGRFQGASRGSISVGLG